MAWLTVSYSPGFQEDLTSWKLSVSDDGKATQSVNVRRFAPSENFKEEFEFQIHPGKIRELKLAIEKIDFSEINNVFSQFVIDDCETVALIYEANKESVSFSAALEYWSWKESHGENLVSSLKEALNVWNIIKELSQYRSRNANFT